MRYYIADSHFFHAELNEHMDRRGFGSVEEMNEYMIRQWNNKVRKRDEVMILGDFSWGGAAETMEVLNRLNGRLYLLEGNHDHFLAKKGMVTERFQWVKPYAEVSDDGRKVILCHYPIMCYKGQYYPEQKGRPRAYMLYGHVHDTLDQRLLEQFQEITRQTEIVNKQGERQQLNCNMINCFCMYSDYTPLSLEEWVVCDRERRERQRLNGTAASAIVKDDSVTGC